MYVHVYVCVHVYIVYVHVCMCIYMCAHALCVYMCACIMCMYMCASMQKERMDVIKQLMRQREVDHYALNSKRMQHFW